MYNNTSVYYDILSLTKLKILKKLKMDVEYNILYMGYSMSSLDAT